MKREMLKGIWEDAAEKFENSFAPDILGLIGHSYFPEKI